MPPSPSPPSSPFLAVADPCLAKQWLASEEVAWTVPMTPGGTIDVKGDCMPLPKLSAAGSRSLRDIYQQPRGHGFAQQEQEQEQRRQ